MDRFLNKDIILAEFKIFAAKQVAMASRKGKRFQLPPISEVLEESRREYHTPPLHPRDGQAVAERFNGLTTSFVDSIYKRKVHTLSLTRNIVELCQTWVSNTFDHHVFIIIHVGLCIQE